MISTHRSRIPTATSAPIRAPRTKCRLFTRPVWHRLPDGTPELSALSSRQVGRPSPESGSPSVGARTPRDPGAPRFGEGHREGAGLPRARSSVRCHTGCCRLAATRAAPAEPSTVAWWAAPQRPVDGGVDLRRTGRAADLVHPSAAVAGQPGRRDIPNRQRDPRLRPGAGHNDEAS